MVDVQRVWRVRFRGALQGPPRVRSRRAAAAEEAGGGCCGGAWRKAHSVVGKSLHGALPFLRTVSPIFSDSMCCDMTPPSGNCGWTPLK